jgi:hypothetical protein
MRKVLKKPCESSDHCEEQLTYTEHSTQHFRIHVLFQCNGTFTKIENMLGYKASLNKFQRIEVIPRMLSGFSRIKLKSVTERKLGNFQIC